MMQSTDYQRVNDLLSQLGDYLDAGGSIGSIQRAYMAAQNSLSMPDHAAEQMQKLAIRLRGAADVAEELSGIFGTGR